MFLGGQLLSTHVRLPTFPDVRIYQCIYQVSLRYHDSTIIMTSRSIRPMGPMRSLRSKPPRNWGRGRWRRPLATDWRAPGMTWGKPRRHGASDPRDGGLFSLRNVAIIVWKPSKFLITPWEKHHGIFGGTHILRNLHLEYDVESDVLKLAVSDRFSLALTAQITRLANSPSLGHPKSCQVLPEMDLNPLQCWNWLRFILWFASLPTNDPTHHPRLSLQSPHVEHTARLTLGSSSISYARWVLCLSRKKKRKSSGKWGSKPEDGMGYPSLDWFKGKSTGNHGVFTIKYRAFL